MDHSDPRLIAPSWWESPSGFLLPGTLQAEIPAGLPPDLPSELRPAACPVFIHTPVDANAQLRPFVDEAMIGWPTSSLEELWAMVESLSFERSIEILSIIAARISDMSGGKESQLELARQVFAGAIGLEKIETALRQNPDAHLFAEQNIFALMQMLIMRGKAATFDQEPTEGELMIFIRSLLASTAIVDIGREALAEEFSEKDRWLPYLIQLSSYYARPQLLIEMARAGLLLEIAAEREEDGSAGDYTLDRWYREDLGLTTEEQSRLMMAFAAHSDAFDGSSTKTHMPASAVAGLLRTAGVEDRKDEALTLISATREQFASRFSALGDGGAEELLWEIRPFNTHPFLRCENGDLILISPRFLQSWFAEGFHHRALNVARTRNKAPGYLKFAGELYESHCVALAESAHRNLPAVMVHGDLPYKSGNSGKTCDITIDYAADLILVEVTNSRFRASTLLGGDYETAREDLERVLLVKCRQLSACIDRVLAEEAPFPDDLGLVRNIWPIVVSAGVPMQTPPLWNHLAKELDGAFSQPRVRPLTILDPEEFEVLCGLVEAGTPLPDILALKCSKHYRELDLKAWLADDPRAPRSRRRPEMLERAFEATARQVAAGMRFAKG